MRRRDARKEREPTIALINIVFLMLIFFLVAGTLAVPLDGDLTLVRTAELERTAPGDALVVHADGRMSFRGQDIGAPSDYLALLDEESRERVRIGPDAELPAIELVAIGRALRRAGAGSVVIVTERGLE